MTEKMKTTAPVSSVGADGAQPNIKKHNEIIANIAEYEKRDFTIAVMQNLHNTAGRFQLQ